MCVELQILLHAAVGVVDAAVERQLGRALLDLVDRNLLQQRHRVVPELAPQHRIELAEQAGRVVVPAPPQILRERRQALVRRRDELPERPRLAHDRRQLRSGSRPASAPRRALKIARLDRLHDQHALQQAAIDQRHAEKRPIRLFAGLAEILEPRMRVASATTCGCSRSATSPASPSVMRMRTRPTLSGRRPIGRREHEVRAIGLEQVDRAHVGLEPPLNFVDDVGERLRWISLRRNQPADLSRFQDTDALRPQGASRTLTHTSGNAGRRRGSARFVALARSCPRKSCGFRRSHAWLGHYLRRKCRQH